MNPALFRFGFICFPAGERPVGDPVWTDVVASWQRFEIGGLAVHHHPETRIRHGSSDGGSALLIGDAFPSPAARSVESILDDLLAAEEDERFFEIFDALSGRFALLLLKDSVQRVFHDPIGSRSLFYRARGEFCIGSHAELVAHAFGHERSAQVRAVMKSEGYRSRSVKYLPGDLTVYDGLHALAPNNFYDVGERRTVRYWPRKGRRPNTFDGFFAALDEHLAALASYLRGRHLPVLGVSTGIDSRTLIAAFRHHGLLMEGVTWLRNTGEIGQAERDVVEGLVARASIEHTYIDLSEAAPDPEGIAAIAKRNVGNYGRRSRITAQLHGHFAGRDAAFIRGYGAEIIRGFYNLSRRPNRARGWPRRIRNPRPKTRVAAIADATPSELLTAYNSSMKVADPGGEYRRLAVMAFEGFMERANYDERLARAGFDLSDVFYWEHRMGMWGSVKQNEMDPALLSMVGFNSRTVYEAAFGLDPGDRLTRELLRQVVRRYDERMAELPYF